MSTKSTYTFLLRNTFNWQCRLAATVLLGSVALANMAQPVSAQVVIPDQTNSGVISRPEEIKIDQDQQIDKQKQLPAAPEKTEIDVPEQEAQESQSQAAHFQVNRIEIEGNSVFTTEELNAIVAKYEGQDQTLDNLGKAVEEINQKYRDAGYLTTEAYIPPQDVENGVVKINIVEGSIGDMSISGNRYFKTWAIQRSIKYEPGAVLNVKELEKSLNQMNQQNAFRLKAILKRGDKTGETDIDFQVAERQPWQISPTFDNQGRPFVGTYRWGVEVQNQNLLGIGDRLFLKWLMAARTQVAAASYFVPLTRWGTEAGVSYTFSYVDVDLPAVGAPRVQGYAHNYSAILSQPLDRNRWFTVDTAFNARRVSTWINQNRDRDGQVDVRSISAGLTFNKLDRYGRSFARFQTDFAPKEWLGSNVAFWKASVYASRLHRLPLNSLLILRATAQWSPDALPPIEQYQLGGAFSVRGYSEGLLIGDRGYNFSAEVRYPIPGLKYVSPWLNDRVQGAYFIDMGQIFHDKSHSGTNVSARPILVGTGVGVRTRLSRYLIGFVDLGWGLTNMGNIEPLAQPTFRTHFGIRSDLLPDSYRAFSNTTAAPIKSKNKKSADSTTKTETTETTEPATEPAAQ